MRFCKHCGGVNLRPTAAFCSHKCNNAYNSANVYQPRKVNERNPFRVGLKPHSVSFWTNIKYDAVTGCWNWTGSLSKHGYGRMQFLGKLTLVPRLSAHFYLGFDLNSSLHVLHRCDNPACFNPKHLFIGTAVDNARDKIAKGRDHNQKRTHCKFGHPLDGRHKEGYRTCLECHRIAARENWRRKHPGFVARVGT